MKELTPATIHAAAVAALPASDIDHYASDLYIKVTPASQQLLNRFQYRHMVKTFVDNIDHYNGMTCHFVMTPV